MDYKKKYNEAFERAKEKYAMFEGMKQGDVLEDVFPELKESEGEKIRKSLLEYLHTLPNHYAHCGVCVPEWISWLEKQGEQKTTIIIPNSRVGCEANCTTTKEWSEEDERLIEEAAECLRKYADKVQGVNSTVYILSLADRIESLRHQKQWKPSDEQIKALDFAIDCTVYQEFQDKCMVLKELLEQLKKLKG